MYPLHIHQKTEKEKQATSSVGEDIELLETGPLKILVLKTSIGINYLENSVNIYSILLAFMHTL